MAQSSPELVTLSTVAQLLAVVLTVASLSFAREVFIPLVLAALLSFLLSPIVNRLQRGGLPNMMAVVITAVLAFVLLAGGFTLVGRELSALVTQLPQHKGELVAKARKLSGMTFNVGGSLDSLADEVTDALENGGERAPAQPKKQSLWQMWSSELLGDFDGSGDGAIGGGVGRQDPPPGTTPKSPIYVQETKNDLPLASWATTAGTVLGPLSTAGLVSVFALFMLIHRVDLRDRMIAVISHGNYVTTTEALDEASQRISRYLLAQTIINASYGMVLAIGLTTIGKWLGGSSEFPNAILWGVMATCLRFVPYLGPIAAAVFPLGLALSVFPGYSVFIGVSSLIITMELVSNNVLEPWLYGASTGISAVAVIVAAVFWGWLWGPVGLLLSTPLTVCLVVLGRYVPRFKVFATLLGEEVEIKDSMRFYQRLLAGDRHHALNLLRSQYNASDLPAVCDRILIPALKQIRNDHEAEHLSDLDADRLFAMAGGLIEDLGNDVGTIELDNTSTTTLPTVVGCASHHLSEMLVLNLFRISGYQRFQLDSMEDDPMPEAVAENILARHPVAVVIVVLPSGGFAQARCLCGAIRRSGYDGPVMVACLGKFKKFDRMFIRFREVGATTVTTSFAQTETRLRSLLNRQMRTTPVPSSEAISVVDACSS